MIGPSGRNCSSCHFLSTAATQVAIIRTSESCSKCGPLHGFSVTYWWSGDNAEGNAAAMTASSSSVHSVSVDVLGHLHRPWYTFCCSIYWLSRRVTLLVFINIHNIHNTNFIPFINNGRTGRPLTPIKCMDKTESTKVGHKITSGLRLRVTKQA